MVINEDQVLSKVHFYQLQRPKQTIRVEVHEIILGSSSKFVAVPVDALGMKSKVEKYHVQGNTEHEALEPLIELIKELPREEIFPK